jgi:hypothetical protein
VESYFSYGVQDIILKIVYEYNETTIQVQEYQILLILIQCCYDERYLPIKTYYRYHNIHIMSKRSLCVNFFTTFLNVLGLSVYVLMSHGRLLSDLCYSCRCESTPDIVRRDINTALVFHHMAQRNWKAFSQFYNMEGCSSR